MSYIDPTHQHFVSQIIIDNTHTPITPGGSPGGDDEAVQFNDAGEFGGDADLLSFDASIQQLRVGNPSYFDELAPGTDGRIVVNGAEGYPQIGLVGEGGSNGSLSFRGGQGTLMAPDTSQDGDFLGVVEFYGMGTTDVSSYGASIEVNVDGTPSSASRVPTSLSIYVSNGTVPSLRFQLRADGNVLMPTLPVGDPHIAGALYTASGVVKQSTG